MKNCYLTVHFLLKTVDHTLGATQAFCQDVLPSLGEVVSQDSQRISLYTLM